MNRLLFILTGFSSVLFAQDKIPSEGEYLKPNPWLQLKSLDLRANVGSSSYYLLSIEDGSYHAPILQGTAGIDLSFSLKNQLWFSYGKAFSSQTFSVDPAIPPDTSMSNCQFISEKKRAYWDTRIRLGYYWELPEKSALCIFGGWDIGTLSEGSTTSNGLYECPVDPNYMPGRVFPNPLFARSAFGFIFGLEYAFVLQPSWRVFGRAETIRRFYPTQDPYASAPQETRYSFSLGLSYRLVNDINWPWGPLVPKGYLCRVSERRDIRALTKGQIQEYFESIGEPKFRAKQVYEWLWQRGAKDFEEMTNLSLSLRSQMQDDFVINHIRVDEMQRSTDGTIKNAVQLYDGMVVESVLIPTEKRITACISSQVGCSLDCNFCATARLKRMRNLNPDEIYDQVVAIQNEAETFFGRPLTNIVFMGMGEPLMNYNNVLAAIEKITSPEGLGMSPKRITVSTVGLSKMIRKLADDGPKFNLALSLHSARDEVRDKIMSINLKNPVADLISACQYWYQQTKSRVTLEYVVWKDINDKKEDIEALVWFCKQVPTKVNLIEYNPIDDGVFQQADFSAVEAYQNALQSIGTIATVRQSRGKDIDAACGQLANKNELLSEG